MLLLFFESPKIAHPVRLKFKLLIFHITEIESCRERPNFIPEFVICSNWKMRISETRPG
jgi:hypothetical protein